MTGALRWSEIDSEELVAVELPDDARELTIEALHQWGGPTRPTDALARAMGFVNRQALHTEGRRLRAALNEREPLSKRDWARVLVATEFVFASAYYGAAGDWADLSGWSDSESLRRLRALQRHLAGLRAPPRLRAHELRDALDIPDDA